MEALFETADLAKLSAESDEMKAQLFAQEAHVAAGAFAFVVQDIQMGGKAVRTLPEYMQAMNELMGFYHAHQAHASTPQGKMVEVSKYVGPRLMEGYKRMEENARGRGLDFPKPEGWENLRGFFNEIYPLRGGKIPPDSPEMGALVQEIAKRHHIPLTSNGEVDSGSIDRSMNEMQGNVMQWMAKIGSK